MRIRSNLHCPICARADRQTALLSLSFSQREGLPSDITLGLCAECDFAYVTPADAEAYARYYAGTKNDQVHGVVGPISFTSAQLPAFVSMLASAAPLDVLDYGCGGGDLLAQLAQAYPQHRYLGFDVNAEVGAAAPAGVTFTQTEPRGTQFDLVILSHVLEHLVDLSWLEHLAGLLKPGGQLYLEVPDPSRYLDHARREFLYYIDRLHVNHFSLRALEILATQHGLRIARYGQLALPYKDGGFYPSHYVFCQDSNAARLTEALPAYLAAERQRPHSLAAVSDPLLVYGFGDYFFRARTPGGPLNGKRILAVIDRRWEELRAFYGDDYHFLPLEEALATYPDAPIAIALSWGAEAVAETIHAQQPERKVVVI